MTVAHNLYIHVPFCASKCAYCAFYSVATSPDWDRYAAGIEGEVDHWARTLGRFSVPTIFFGGGTPSLMPTHILDRILTHIRAAFDVDADAEITLESNPGTLDAARLDDIMRLGINRLSVGVQSFHDDELKFLGRRHSAADAQRLMDAAHARGLRVSADFIYGLPGHTADHVIALCREINKTGLRHCSLYELTIEPNTPLGRMRPDMPDNDAMADMYLAISQNLTLPRYEVSNYAAPGDACRHNMNVWDGAPYIGLGRGAAGRVRMGDTWYDQMGHGARFEPITPRDRAVEKIITGLRTARGVALTPDVRDVLNGDRVATMSDYVYTTPDGRLVATEKGILLLDNLLLELGA
ncbi:radical SAM family heme chaperone HemW [bacterium]|nr:radical SAM family heme chaperone HemW [bacterium]